MIQLPNPNFACSQLDIGKKKKKKKEEEKKRGYEMLKHECQNTVKETNAGLSTIMHEEHTSAELHHLLE